jgi:hypothetical protein
MHPNDGPGYTREAQSVEGGVVPDLVIESPQSETAPRYEEQQAVTVRVVQEWSRFGLIRVHQQAASGSPVVAAGRRVVHDFGEALDRLAES